MCFCLFWFIPAHSCTCFVPPICPLFFHLSFFPPSFVLGPLFPLCPPFLFNRLLPSFLPPQFFIQYLNTKVKGCDRMMFFEDAETWRWAQRYIDKLNLRKLDLSPRGRDNNNNKKKPWKCYFSSFTSDSWNVSLTERQAASQQIRRQRARSVLNAVTCPKSVSPPGCYDLTMLWVYVRVQMEHCCNWIYLLKKLWHYCIRGRICCLASERGKEGGGRDRGNWIAGT